jgi:hypothetical protein
LNQKPIKKSKGFFMVNFQLYFQEILTFGLKISQYRSGFV